MTRAKKALKSAPAKGKVVKSADWPALKLEFVNGVMSTADLALTHRLTKAAVQGRVARGKWMAERQRLSAAVSATTQETLTQSRRSELAEFNASDLKMAKALRGLVAGRITKAQREGAAPLSSVELRALASTAESAQKMGRLALGASTDNHGIGGPGGEGPVAVTAVPMDDYLKARTQAMADF